MILKGIIFPIFKETLEVSTKWNNVVEIRAGIMNRQLTKTKKDNINEPYKYKNMPNLIHTKRIQIKNTLVYQFYLSILQNQHFDKMLHWQGCREKGILLHYWWECPTEGILGPYLTKW